MTQARRALIRRAIEQAATEANRLTQSAAAARAALRRQSLASNTTSFAHLNTPDACARMVEWQASFRKGVKK